MLERVKKKIENLTETSWFPCYQKAIGLKKQPLSYKLKDLSSKKES